MNEQKPISSLPRIITVLAKKDHGPCDGGATAVCPHCGADGRYVYTFLCEDGSRRGAMAGCIKLFPRHPLCYKVQGIFDKVAEYSRKHFKPASWDLAVLDAVAALNAGQINVAEWEHRVNNAFAQRQRYLERRYGRR